MDSKQKILTSQFSVDANSIENIPKGFFGGGFKVSAQNKKYFFKEINKELNIIDTEKFKKSLKHYEQLSKTLEFVPQIYKTKDKNYFYQEGEKIYVLYEFIDSINDSESEKSLVIEKIVELHSIKIPDNNDIANDFTRETTSKRFEKTIHFLEKNSERLLFLGSDYKEILNNRFTRFNKLLNLIDKSKLVYVHKDPFSNTIHNSKGLYLIDWDDLSIATPEADLWMIIDNRFEIGAYEKLSQNNLNKINCEFFALENYFLYFEAYINKFYSLDSDQVKSEVIEGIKDGINTWFESVYKNFL